MFVNSNSTIQSVTVRDFAGKAIRTYTDAISSGINVSFLSAGSYLLEVNTTAGTEVSKFLKN
ncbi:MAG: T9SS type A sorting domain-containing protein [Bacteroidia bacterium]